MTFTSIDQRFIDTVLWIMQKHIGKENRISRPALLREVKRFYPCATDRQVRDALSMTPVISSSGVGGYWLPANQTEVNDYLSELSSRQARLSERKHIISRWMISKTDEKAHQPSLLEVAR